LTSGGAGAGVSHVVGFALEAVVFVTASAAVTAAQTVSILIPVELGVALLIETHRATGHGVDPAQLTIVRTALAVHPVLRARVAGVAGHALDVLRLVDIACVAVVRAGRACLVHGFVRRTVNTVIVLAVGVAVASVCAQVAVIRALATLATLALGVQIETCGALGPCISVVPHAALAVVRALLASAIRRSVRVAVVATSVLADGPSGRIHLTGVTVGRTEVTGWQVTLHERRNALVTRLSSSSVRVRGARHAFRGTLDASPEVEAVVIIALAIVTLAGLRTRLTVVRTR